MHSSVVIATILIDRHGGDLQSVVEFQVGSDLSTTSWMLYVHVDAFLLRVCISSARLGLRACKRVFKIRVEVTANLKLCTNLVCSD